MSVRLPGSSRGSTSSSASSKLPAAVVLDASVTPKDIDTTGVSDTQVLAYDLASGKFKPVPAAAGGTSSYLDLWNTQGNPAAVTDWGTIINTLVTNGTKRFDLASHDFPFTTPINVKNTWGVEFRGAVGTSAYGESFSGGSMPGRLRYTGANTARIIDARGAWNFRLTTMAVYYDNTGGAFAGIVVDLAQDFAGTGRFSSTSRLFDCYIGALNGAVRTADMAVNWDGAVNCLIRDSRIGDAAWAVLGVQANTYSNANRIVNTIFLNCRTGFIGNIGNNWVIEAPTFEVSDCPACIDSDLLRVTGGLLKSDFVVRGAWSGDVSVGNVTPQFRQRVGNQWDSATFEGDNSLTTSHNGLLFQLQGSGRIAIARSVLTAPTGQAVIDCGNVGGGDTAKDALSIEDVTIDATTDINTAIINQAGHNDLSIQRVGLKGPTTRRRVRYGKNDGAGYLPTVAIHSGVTTVSNVVIKSGTDEAGWIRITFNTVPAAYTPLVDITFAVPYLKAPSWHSGDGDTTAQLPTIFLDAMSDEALFGTPLAWQVAAGTKLAMPVVMLPSLTGFSLGLANPTTISSAPLSGYLNIAIAYHVIGG